MRAIGTIILSCALILIAPTFAAAGGKSFGSHSRGAHSFGHASGLHRSFHNFRGYHKSRMHKQFAPNRSARHFKSSRFKSSAFERPRRARKHGHAQGHIKRRHGKFRSKHVVIYPGYYWGRGRDVIVTQVNSGETQPVNDGGAGRDDRGSFQAKLIHIDDGGALSESRSLAQLPPADTTGEPGDCLSVQQEILVGEQALEAFGMACLQPDGTWRLMPTKTNPE
jgi:hypothetical protein